MLPFKVGDIVLVKQGTATHMLEIISISQDVTKYHILVNSYDNHYSGVVSSLATEVIVAIFVSVLST